MTIASTTVFSTLNALTLSPALSAIFLRPSPQRNAFFRGFNQVLSRGTTAYSRVVSTILRRSAVMALVYVTIVGLAAWGFISLPTGFLPAEDQGYLLTNIQLPDAASLKRTREVIERVNAIMGHTPGVDHWISVGGFSLLSGASASNAATIFVSLLPWEERTDPELQMTAIVRRLFVQFRQIQDAIVLPLTSAPISGLGNTSGFDMQLQDRGGSGLTALQQMADELVRDGQTQSGLIGLYTSFRSNVPQLFAHVDRV